VSEECTIVVNGTRRRVDAGTTLAVALLNLGITGFRADLQGAPRAPVCGMGTCFECRATVDGQPQVRTCLIAVAEGMQVEVGE
jgi:sarcosine oxidase subunit alpha